MGSNSKSLFDAQYGTQIEALDEVVSKIINRVIRDHLKFFKGRKRPNYIFKWDECQRIAETSEKTIF